MQSLSTPTRDVEARKIVGRVLQIVGGLAGLPAFAGTCFFAWQALDMPPANATPNYDQSSQLLGLYYSAMSVVDKAFQFGAGMMRGVLLLLAFICAVVAFVSLLWFLTGRALRRERRWAPVAGTLLLLHALVTFAGLTLAYGFEDFRVAGPLAAAVGSAVGIWMLWRPAKTLS